MTGGFFDGLGVAARVGRTIVDSDLSASAPHVAVISYAFWQRAFAGSPGVVGQSITLNSIPYTIVGVAARGFSGVQTGIADEVWIPITRTAMLAPWGVSSIDESPMTSERWWWLTVMGRLRPGVSREQAAAGAGTALVSTIANLNRQSEKEESGKSETAKNELAPSGKLPFIKFEDGSRGMPFMEEEYSEPITLLMGLVGLVLLAACANLATLLLARASTRSREIAVRLALGASPVRVWRQMLTESLLLSFSGGVLGVAAAPLAMRAIAAGLTRRGSNGLSEGLILDHRVLLFTAGLSVLTGLCFGIAPAVRSGRIDVNSSLKDGAATDSGRSRLPMRWLVVAQAAISTVLLIVSGIFLHSLAELRRQATGFDEKHLLVFSLQPSQSGYNDGQLPALYAEIRERLAGLPSVTSATTLGNRLISGWQSNFEVQIEGYKAPDNQDPNVISNTVGADFLRTSGILLLMGRDFAESDTIASPKVAILNEAFAKKYFAAANPLGRHLQFKPWDAGKVVDKPVSYTIVGICGDARYTSMRDEMKPTWYEAMGQQDGSHLKNVHFMLRSRGDPTAVTASVLAALRGIDPGLVASDIKTEAEQIDDSISSDRMFAQLSTFFGGLALLLAAIGLYGTLAYSVARRQRELGIRLALGAERRKVVSLVLSQGLRLVAIGIVAGWILSALAGKMLAHLTESVLFHVTMLDAVSFVGAAMVLACLAAVTAFVPARRAANTDPIEVLRAE